ncbi:MAG TPA: hypothetical protein VGF99_11235 [Myxococcota bacterium]
MRLFPVCFVVVTVVTVFGGACAADDTPTTTAVSMLTYNVAGLPQGLNDDQFPEQNIPQVSPKLNAYELVVVQEDFSYTDELRAELTLPFQSYELVHSERFVNDGLNVFSTLRFDLELERVRWVACHGGTDNGSDCLANKGFAVSVHDLPNDDDDANDEDAPLALPVLNLHAEAGGSAEDIAARTAGFEQLIAFINDRFADRALVVAGDTNLDHDDVEDEALLQRFLDETGLIDACRSLACGDEHIDRVFTKSGGDLDVRAASWDVADEFVDADGNDLSDHKAIHVDLEITTR